MSRIRRGVLSCMVCWMFTLGLAVAPVQPAHAMVTVEDIATTIARAAKVAADAVGFSDVMELFGEVGSILGTILTFLGDAFNALFSAFNLASAAKIGAQQVNQQIKGSYTDEIIRTGGIDAQTRWQVPLMMEHAPPKNAHLCRQIMIHQLATTTGDYERAVSRLASKAIESMYRGMGMNGDGPMYAKEAFQLRCKYKYGNRLDGYPESCTDVVTTVGPFRRTFVDADLSPFTMDGSLVLEMPKMDTQVHKIDNTTSMLVTVANPQNDEQRMWIAGLNYCFQMAGPRPSPPVGKFALTDEGLVASAMFSRGLSMQSAYNLKCTDLLAHYTRPNPESSAIIKDQNTMCKAIVGVMGKTNLFDQETIDTKFGGCKLGLTPYQAEYIQKASCKTPAYYMLSANSGVLQGDMMDAAVACGASWNQWKTNDAGIQGSLVDAVKGQMKIRKIWNSMSTKGGVFNNYNMSLGPDLVPPEAAVRPVVMRNNNDNFKQGTVLSVDEISLPSVVEQ